jgi:hypothetical protein
MTALTVELPEPLEHELVLEPSPQATRGVRAEEDEVPAAALEPLDKRLSIGGPVTRHIGRESTDDIELQRFLEGEGADHDFYLVRLDCTLRHDDDEPFASALLAIDLSAKEDDGSAPIAWSMDPLELFDAVPVSRTIGLSPSLKILGLGLEATTEVGDKHERKDVFVEALYQLESNPTWAMYRTGSTQLRGVQGFTLVVQARKGTTTVGRMTASAMVERKRFGLIAYQAAFADQSRRSFEISPSAVESARLEASGA